MNNVLPELSAGDGSRSAPARHLASKCQATLAGSFQMQQAHQPPGEVRDSAISLTWADGDLMGVHMLGPALRAPARLPRASFDLY